MVATYSRRATAVFGRNDRGAAEVAAPPLSPSRATQRGKEGVFYPLPCLCDFDLGVVFTLSLLVDSPLGPGLVVRDGDACGLGGGGLRSPTGRPILKEVNEAINAEPQR